MELHDVFSNLVVGGGAAAGTWFAIKRMARGDAAQGVAAKIDVQAQEGLLRELKHWQDLALEAGPRRSPDYLAVDHASDSAQAALFGLHGEERRPDPLHRTRDGRTDASEDNARTTESA